MRRPILLPAGSLVFGMILAYIQGGKANLALVALLLGFISIIALYLLKKIISKEQLVLLRNRSICCVLFFLLGIGIFVQEYNRIYILNDYNGQTVTLNGSVIFAESKGKDVYYLTLLAREVEGFVLRSPEKAQIRVYGSLENFQDYSGRNIQIRGKLEIPSPARNPKCFDYQQYLKTKKIGSLVNVNPRFIKQTGWQGGPFHIGWRLLNKISLVKQEFISALSLKIPPNQMALVKGMLFGDKSDIDSETLLKFQRNSTAHILAVSGLHVGMVYALFMAIFWKRNSLFFNLVTLSLLIVYAFMSFLAPSVVRAVFMIGLHIIARGFHFRYDLLSATVFTGGVLLLINPMMLLNAGFQLSYIALLSMSFLIPFLRFYLTASFFKPFLPLIAIQIGLIPIIAFHFNYLSFIGIIANIPTIILAGFIIPLLIILFPIHFFLTGIIMNTLTTSLEWLIQAIISMNEALYFQGKFSLLVPSPPLWSMFLFYGVLLFLTSELVRIWLERKYSRKLLGSIVIIVFISALCGAIQEDEFKGLKIIFLDVGQGDCLFIETPTGKTAMIDSGGSSRYDVGCKTLLPYLLKNGHRKLDLGIVTHLHQDHYGGFKTLSKELTVGGLVIYEGYECLSESIIGESGFQSDQLIFASKGDVIKLDESVSIEILYPGAWKAGDIYRPEDENQMSLVMMVVYNGIKILITGDIDQKGETAVINAMENIQDLECHILSVPHHGSKYSTGSDFILSTKPDCAVIQVGKNNFGHPSSSVLEKCLERDIMVFRNDLHGAVGIQGENWDGQNLWVRTMITPELEKK